MDYNPLGKPSLLTRIAVGKGLGFIIGLIGFFIAPMLYAEIELFTRVGILLWYPTMGAMIGMFGVMNWHPLIQLPMPWWFRATFIGAWMNLVLVFFAHAEVSALITAAIGVAASPFWLVVEGAVLGGLIGFLATKAGGEGPDTVEIFDH